MDFEDFCQKLHDNEKQTYERNIETLNKERSILKVMHAALAQITTTDEPHDAGGGYVSRPFGTGTHERPATHYRLQDDQTEIDVDAAVRIIRKEFEKANMEIHLTKIEIPEQYYERWTYHFDWHKPDAAVNNEAFEKISFSFHVWMASDGVCKLVEDGWKDPEKKYKVECTNGVPDKAEVFAAPGGKINVGS